MNNTFTKENTNIAKGIAIIMLLVHHLFFISQQSLFSDIHMFTWDGIDYGLFYTLSAFFKVTVSLFAFLSAYGLYVSYGKTNSIVEFYKKRFFKLYFNFWIIWLLFVPVLIVFFNKTFSVVYGKHIFVRFLSNFFGVQSFFDLYSGYNGSWWFISLIVMFYLLFPLFYKISKNNYVLFYTFVCSLFLYFLGYSNKFCFVYYYIPVFFLGIICAKYNIFVKIRELLSAKFNFLLFLLLILFLITRLMLVHNLGQGYSSCIDIVIVYLIIQLSFNVLKPEMRGKSLSRLGELSMDIYMFHIFIIAFFYKVVYFSTNPFVIFFIMLIICVFIAWLIQKFKKYIIKKVEEKWGIYI